MNSTKEKILFFINCFRCFPHLILFLLHKNKNLIKADIDKAFRLMENKPFKGYANGLIHLLTLSRPYRNLFYYRLRPYSAFLRPLCRGLAGTELSTKTIGGGFALIHGYASAIGAVEIGENCTIYQQVTIGGSDIGAPIIGDNVTIYAGAVIVGKITIGNNVTIGANSTVIKSIPDNCMVLPGTSKVMKWRKR